MRRVTIEVGVRVRVNVLITLDRLGVGWGVG